MIAGDGAFPVIWDSGASITISPDRRGAISPPSTITQLNGIAKGQRIEGEGKVHWSFHDSSGKLHTLELPAYYVPKIRVRLLSTTSLLQTAYSEETIKVEAHQLTMSGIEGDSNRSSIVALVNPDNNLPTSQASRQPAVLPAAECLNSTTTCFRKFVVARITRLRRPSLRQLDSMASPTMHAVLFAALKSVVPTASKCLVHFVRRC